MDITQVITQHLLSILALVVGAVANQVINYILGRFGLKGLKIAEILATNAVKAVEQTSTELHGQEKFDLAKQKLVEMAKQQGLNINSAVIDTFIESAVKNMNEAYGKATTTTDTVGR